MFSLVMRFAPVSTFSGTLALGRGKRGLDAVISHAERVLHNQRHDRAVFQQIDEFIVRVETDQFDFICDLVLGDRLSCALGHNEIRGEHSAKVRIGCDQVGHDVQGSRRLTVSNLVSNEFQTRIFRRYFLFESLGTLIKRTDAGNRGDERDIPLRLAIFRRDGSGKTVGSHAPALHVIGREEGGEGLGVSSRINADNFNFLGRFVDRFAERGELGRRDDNGRRVAGNGVLENRDLAIDVGFGLSAELWNVHAKLLASLAGAGQHNLPVKGRRILDDDRDGNFLVRGRGCLKQTGGGDCCEQADNKASA